jgi:hypothetical protein
MTAKPILFSGPMVRAILDGRKTQTRRVMRTRVVEGGAIYDGAGGQMDHVDTEEVPEAPKYRPADILWVRETWLHVPDAHDGMGDCTYYRAAPPEIYRKPYLESAPRNWDKQNAEWMKENGFKWKPSIHMPRWASRLTLEVTEVRVQRLQEISEEDAKAEGAEPALLLGKMVGGSPDMSRRGFAKLWNSINEKRGFGWGANPWVVAVTFTPHQVNVDEFLKARAA